MLPISVAPSLQTEVLGLPRDEPKSDNLEVVGVFSSSQLCPLSEWWRWAAGQREPVKVTEQMSGGQVEYGTRSQLWWP